VRDWSRRSQQALLAIAVVLVIGALHVAKSAVVPLLFAAFLAIAAVAIGRPAASYRRTTRGRSRGHRAVAGRGRGPGSQCDLAASQGMAGRGPADDAHAGAQAAPGHRFIAKVESVSEQAGRVTDPGAAKSVATTPAEGDGEEVDHCQQQDWLIGS